MTASSDREAPFDAMTVIAVGLVAYFVKNLVHEALGHGGACVLVGGEPQALSSAWWDGSYEGVSPWGRRAVRAAGTLANLGLGLALLPGWRLLRNSPRIHLRAFVWLLIVTNLFSGAGYLLADPIGSFGDWTAFLEGLEPRTPLRVGLVLVGLLLSGFTVRFALRSIESFLGTDVAERRWRARWLCLGPYVAGGAVFTIAGLFNPQGPIFAFTSALATFGGTAFLAWLPAWVRRPATDTGPAPALPRSWPWVVAGGVSAFFIIGILGRGITLA
jgi:hypothetical protein